MGEGPGSSSNVYEAAIAATRSHLSSKGYLDIRETCSTNELVATDPVNGALVFVSVRFGFGRFPGPADHPSLQDRVAHVRQWLGENMPDADEVMARFDNADFLVSPDGKAAIRLHHNVHRGELLRGEIPCSCDFLEVAESDGCTSE